MSEKRDVAGKGELCRRRVVGSGAPLGNGEMENGTTTESEKFEEKKKGKLSLF